ncbi:Cyclopropane-fatty-acyl-phospholipid synthase (EC [Olavius algarvensis associated proteobacterium Delta 3]|nr:Cyclopropane-fatty-acyl-phospholipid synthase (EC [Olavius algarvensis associated proteobacterium Delta 3]CAB5120843.1 Cyclopropane-fatty-acyl-phospholipid synthase (EC [Olavius algarvensis associated proteobacterium Delta 3]
MTSPCEHRLLEQLLDCVGVALGGSRPFDIRVNHPEFFPRVLAGGTLALGESYMDGWWDCEALDQLFERLLRARLDCRVAKSQQLLWARVKGLLTGSQSRFRAFEVGKRHYDLGNDLFAAMLDRRMNYSCAYWQHAQDLDRAQEDKLELTCRKLMLEPGMRVLDIGCGWGGLAIYAAEHYGAEVTGITVSREQADWARKRIGDLPVRIELKDYRELRATFDRIVSIGRFEHVGTSRYRTFMKMVSRCLKPGGLFLLHTIGCNRSVEALDPWFQKYIFPNAVLPSARQITAAAEGLFVLEDWHSFGSYYDPTLMAWQENFARRWHCLSTRYDRRFYRMWNYYLLSCAGSFRARRNQLWQILFSDCGIKGRLPDYRSIRSGAHTEYVETLEDICSI